MVGGVALNFQDLVRATEDIDLFVRPTEDNIARLRLALTAVWPDPEVRKISASDLGGNYPTVPYGPDKSFLLDLHGRLGNAFSFDDFEAETLKIDGPAVQVATPAMLFRMKRDTERPVDCADALALQPLFDLE